MASPLKKLPPEVIRELRRHVSPTPLKKSGNVGAANQLRGAQVREKAPSSSLKWVVGGCVGLVATAASFPVIATWWIHLNDKDDPLTAAQVRRGAFQNSGSRDVGRDPNWDFKKGEYKKDAGYYAIFEEDKKRKLPGQFLAMSDEKLQKHEKKIEAFAKGEARND